MRSYHRKTLVRKEHWPRIDDWYYCPMVIVEERIQKERDRLDSVSRKHTMWYSYATWEVQQGKLESRLAHACEDGRIRAPSYVEYYRGKGNLISIYGKCRHCGSPLSDGIKGIIIMEEEL